jgi:hypothetical protein
MVIFKIRKTSWGGGEDKNVYHGLFKDKGGEDKDITEIKTYNICIASLNSSTKNMGNFGR